MRFASKPRILSDIVIDILDNGSSRAAFIHDAKATGNDDKIKQALRIVDLSIKVRGADLFEFEKHLRHGLIGKERPASRELNCRPSDAVASASEMQMSRLPGGNIPD
jgi:hypothetical protein